MALPAFTEGTVTETFRPFATIGALKGPRSSEIQPKILRELSSRSISPVISGSFARPTARNPPRARPEHLDEIVRHQGPKGPGQNVVPGPTDRCSSRRIFPRPRLARGKDAEARGEDAAVRELETKFSRGSADEGDRIRSIEAEKGQLGASAAEGELVEAPLRRIVPSISPRAAPPGWVEVPGRKETTRGSRR